MDTYWWAMGGGKRGVAVQEIQAEDASHRCLRNFDGFEAVVYSKDLSKDGETLAWLCEEANSKNMLAGSMNLLDVLDRAGEPMPAFCQVTE